MNAYLQIQRLLLLHSVEIMEIYSHNYFTKISWNQRFINVVTKE